MEKNYNTKMASLKATVADVRKLNTKQLDAENIKRQGKDIFEYILDDRGTLANDELDIWNSNVSTDEDGNVIVREYPQKFEVSIEDMTEEQKSILQSAVKVENNQVLGADDAHLMFFETNALIDGFRMFYQSTALTTFNSDLSNLVEGMGIFRACTNLTSFSGDLSNLVQGKDMFRETPITSFSADLSNLVSSYEMFYGCTSLTSFNGDLSSLVYGVQMFPGCKFTSFTSDLSSLTHGGAMFWVCINLTSFTSDLSSLVNANTMFANCKLDAPSLANIIHTINTPTEKGTITIGLGIDDTDEARQSIAEAIWCKDWAEVNQEFTNKNWTVEWQFNGAPTSAATLDINTSSSPIWAKLEEVVADENGNIPYYFYVSEDGSKYFNLYWYHSSNGNNEDYEYFGSLLEACGHFGIVPKEYAAQN